MEATSSVFSLGPERPGAANVEAVAVNFAVVHFGAVARVAEAVHAVLSRV